MPAILLWFYFPSFFYLLHLISTHIHIGTFCMQHTIPSTALPASIAYKFMRAAWFGFTNMCFQSSIAHCIHTKFIHVEFYLCVHSFSFVLNFERFKYHFYGKNEFYFRTLDLGKGLYFNLMKERKRGIMLNISFIGFVV